MGRSTQFLAWAALAALLCTAGAAAGVPELLSYQGKLLDHEGSPVLDGEYRMLFRFYNSCFGGDLLLTDWHPRVAVRNGIYAVALGSGFLTPGLEASLGPVFVNHATVCLGVRVEDDDEMVPRLPILSSGYAVRAAIADDTLFGAVGATADVTWTGEHTFGTDVTFDNTFSVKWPHLSGDNPPATGFRITKFTASPPGQEAHPGGELDEQFMICYNCRKGDTEREDFTQHSWNQKIEANYWNELADREQLEVNWNYISPEGERYRPFAFVHQVTGHCSHDGSRCSADATCGAGNSCVDANRSSFTWVSDPQGICAENHHVPCRTNEDCSGECLLLKKTVMDADGRLWAWGGINVPTISAGAMPSSTASVKINTDVEPSGKGGTVRGLFTLVDFNGRADADSELSSAVGVTSQVWLTGDVAGRDIRQEATGVSSSLLVTQTGGAGADGEPPVIERAYGFSFRFVPTGNHAIVRESAGLMLAVPGSLAATSPVQVLKHHGILVKDQLGLGSMESDAMLVDGQSGGPTQGNIRMAGGSWDDGHLVLEDLHLWADRPGNLLRVRRGAPESEDDGHPLHVPPGTDPDWGVIYWGSTDVPASDTGHEVCALAGLTCLETWEMGRTMSRNCATSQHDTERFLALCHE